LQVTTFKRSVQTFSRTLPRGFLVSPWSNTVKLLDA
jgi:hypothetical protein